MFDLLLEPRGELSLDQSERAFEGELVGVRDPGGSVVGQLAHESADEVEHQPTGLASGPGEGKAGPRFKNEVLPVRCRRKTLDAAPQPDRPSTVSVGADHLADTHELAVDFLVAVQVEDEFQNLLRVGADDGGSRGGHAHGRHAITTLVVMTTRTDVTTRERLLDASMRLFARQGVAATTVGQIEAEAGMSPRSGALYKYFDSKASMLDAGLERHLATIDDMGDQLASRQLGEMRVELALVGHWLLTEMDAERDITHIIEREGAAHPELRDRMRDGISERGYRIASDFVARWCPELGKPERDALAVVAVGALINVRRSRWTFGEPPLGLADAEVLRAWVELCATFFAARSSGR